MSNPFTLDVNYWPRRRSMYWWGNFDAGEVREEFSVIKEISLTIVRPSVLACQPVVFIWFLDIDLNKKWEGQP